MPLVFCASPSYRYWPKAATLCLALAAAGVSKKHPQHFSVITHPRPHVMHTAGRRPQSDSQWLPRPQWGLLGPSKQNIEAEFAPALFGRLSWRGVDGRFCPMQTPVLLLPPCAYVKCRLQGAQGSSQRVRVASEGKGNKKRPKYRHQLVLSRGAQYCTHSSSTRKRIRRRGS